MSLSDLVKESQSKIIEQAREYIDYGLPIIPICSADHSNMPQYHLDMCKTPGKMPLIKKWQAKSFTDHEELEHWQRQFKHFNLGLPLGDASGYVAIDIDGDQGFEILKKISGGDLPQTWEFGTGNGHRLIYRLPPGITTKKKKIVGDGVHQECALLVTGQQTVIPPSVHYTGALYEWVEGNTPTDIVCGESPQWIVDLVTSGEMSSNESEMMRRPFDPNGPDTKGTSTLNLNEIQDRAKESKKQNAKNGRKVLPEDWETVVEEGGRDNQITKLTGSIIAKGLPKEMVRTMIKKYNEEYCTPPLDEAKVDLIINNLYELDVAKRSEMGLVEAPAKFLPTKYIDAFQKECKKRGMEFRYDVTTDLFYQYNSKYGTWKAISRQEIELMKVIRTVITSFDYGANPLWDNTHNIQEFIAVLKEYMGLATRNQYSAFDLGANVSRHLTHINVINGMLDWKTGELLPHAPEYLSTVQFPVEYNENMKCETWEKALESWVPDKKTRDVLQEYIGLCLIPDTSYRVALYLYGAGANGKSMFIDTVSRLFATSCTHLSLNKLKEKFSIRYLQNVLINVCGELDNGRIKDTAAIKAAIAGDDLRGEIKGGAEFSFKPVARMLFASNHYPVANESSHGWNSRIKIIPFTQQFPVNPRYKKEFEHKVYGDELPGLLNWAIEGLRRVQDNSDFSTSVIIEQEKNEYMKINDHIFAFVNEMVISHITGKSYKEAAIPTIVLYEIYLEWADYQGIKPLAKRWFNNRIEQAGFIKQRSAHFYTAASGGSPTTLCWMGMTLNPEAEFFKENTNTKARLSKAMGAQSREQNA